MNKKITMEEFAEKMKASVAKTLGLDVRVHKVNKLNQGMLYGLTFIEPEAAAHPTIYLEPFFDDFKKTGELAPASNMIIDTFRRSRPKEPLDVEWFKDFGQVRKKVFHTLVNYESNRELLASMPHTRYLDLAKVYRVMFQNKDIGNGSILIHNSHLDLWDTTVEELERAARENTPKLHPLWVMRLADTITKAMPEAEIQEAPAISPFVDMYTVSNTCKFNGAAAVFYENVLGKFSEILGGDVVILPSSVHECIVLSLPGYGNTAELGRMVREVNRTMLEPDEVLSDHAYIYRKDTGSIEII